MAVTVSTSGTSVTFCNGYGYTVDINVTYTGSSTTYKLITLRRGGCSTQTFPVGNFSYGVYEDFYGGSTRLERGDFVVSSSSGGGGDSGDDLTDGPCNCSSWFFKKNAIGEVIERTSDGWATIQFTIYVDNEEYFETRGRLTGTTVSSGGTSTEVGRTSNINIDGYDTGSFTFTVSNWYWDNNTTSKQFTLVSDWSIYLYASDTSQGMQTGCTSKIMYATVNYTPAVQYDDFFWADGTTTISPGDTFTDKIDASTWLDLISKVNKLKGTNISTSGVSSGQKFTASHYNNIASALGVKTVSSGADCDASLFNALRNAYRSQAGLT